MKICKPHIFKAYARLYKLLLPLICCFLLACSGQNSAKQSLLTANQIQISESAININTASAAELEKLPDIGAKTAQEIVEYRRRFGHFAKPEHLLLVRGISDEHYRKLRNLVRVE